MSFLNNDQPYRANIDNISKSNLDRARLIIAAIAIVFVATIIATVKTEGFTYPEMLPTFGILTPGVDTELPSAGYTYTTPSGGENTYMVNKLTNQQELIKSVSQEDRNFNLDYNHGMYTKSQGWWADVINNEQSASNFYSKPNGEWIWPY